VSFFFVLLSFLVLVVLCILIVSMDLFILVFILALLGYVRELVHLRSYI